MYPPVDRRHVLPRRFAAPAWQGTDALNVLAGVCFALLLVAALVGSTVFQASDGGSVTGEGNLGNQLLYGGTFLLLLFGSGIRSVRTLLCLPVGITLLIGYCYLSVFWAVDPGASFRRATLTAIMTWTTFRIVGDLGPDRTLRLMRQFLLVLLIANFFAVLLLPNGVHRNVIAEEGSVIGSWRGIIAHKNAAGAICAVTILLFLFDNRQFSRVVNIATMIAAAVFLYFTNSKTSHGVLALSLVAGLLIRPFNANHRVVLGGVLMLVAALGMLFVSANIDVVDNIMNDPTALTGRGEIWPFLLDYAAQHPWTGAGYQSFWGIGDASPIWTLTSGWVATEIQHGHNGYLDLLVTIGIPGLVLAVVTLLLWPLIRLLFSLAIGKPRRSLLLSIIIFCAGQNMTESTLFNGSYTHVFLMIAIAIIYRQSQGSAGQHHDLRRRALRFLGLRRARPVR